LVFFSWRMFRNSTYPNAYTNAYPYSSYTYTNTNTYPNTKLCTF
jgi:hypothetical protein